MAKTMNDLDFTRAEFVESPGQHCAWCTRGLAENYFQLQSVKICAVCAERARQVIPTPSAETFRNALLFGTLAAAVAGVAYFMLCRLAEGGLMMFTSIGVGYVIGKAVRSASKGVGGRRYQVLAAVLTYLAVATGSSAALLTAADVPAWAYPLLAFSPIIYFFTGHTELAALQLLFALAGIRWAWMLLAGKPLQVTGPHPITE